VEGCSCCTCCLVIIVKETYYQGDEWRAVAAAHVADAVEYVRAQESPEAHSQKKKSLQVAIYT
jgi:hypothetical protein